MKREIAMGVGIVAGIVLAGCGGSGTVASSPAATRFAPNYVQELDAVRRWVKPGVTMHLAPTTRANAPSLAAEGLRLWEPHLQEALAVASVSTSDADITVRMVPHGTLPERVLGRTQVTYRASDHALLRAEMLVDERLSDEFFVQTIAHELGHALGLEGHSQREEDLMSPLAEIPARLTERDANTLRTIYATTRTAPALSDGEVVTETVCEYRR